MHPISYFILTMIIFIIVSAFLKVCIWQQLFFDRFNLMSTLLHLFLIAVAADNF